MADSEWPALAAAAQRGDKASYRQLLGELRPWLQRYYVRRLPPAMVNDAVQETLIAIHEKLHSCDIAAVVRCQKHRGIRDFIRCAEPAERHSVQA